MPIRFTQGEIAKALKRLGFKPAGKGRYLYEGIGNDGLPHLCKFDYHKDRDTVATGTAQKIAKSLGFNNQQELKEYINRL